MALFTKADLAKVTIRKDLYESAGSILRKATLEFSEDKTYGIFVSHSYSDADEILKLKQVNEKTPIPIFQDNPANCIHTLAVLRDGSVSQKRRFFCL